VSVQEEVRQTFSTHPCVTSVTNGSIVQGCTVQ